MSSTAPWVNENVPITCGARTAAHSPHATAFSQAAFAPLASTGAAWASGMAAAAHETTSRADDPTVRVFFATVFMEILLDEGGGGHRNRLPFDVS